MMREAWKGGYAVKKPENRTPQTEGEATMYDFDKITDRRNTDSIKWDIKDNELPMWVADMDFPAAPEIVDAFYLRLKHPVFGYSKLRDEWFDAYINWWKYHHELAMDREHIMFCAGVVPAVASAIRQLTAPGDKIVLLTPNYNHFFNCIKDNGREALEVEMNYDGNRYSIDFDALEKALAEPNVGIMIVCNPQNPTGTVWNKEEFHRIGVLCEKHNVIVISDEIHCDIITPGKAYTPFASVSDINKNNSITCIAPTKAFNLAGLQTSALYISNDLIRKKVRQGIEKDEISMPNSFAAVAAVAAFNNGKTWLDELNTYIYQNKQIVRCFLQKEIPQIKLVWGDATYLLWLDCTALKTESTELAATVRKNTGLYVMAGSYYGKGGQYFLRMNIACPQTQLLDGLERLKKAVIGG